MAGSLTNYAENAILNWISGVWVTTKSTASASPSTPTTGGVVARLLTALPTDTGTTLTGATYTGTVASNIPAVTPSTGSWGITSDGSGNTIFTYNADLTFTRDNVAGTDTIVGVGLFDSATTANCLAYTDFTASKAVGANESLVITSGTLKLTLG